MVDLTVLKNLWTVAGAREVFAELITHSVRSIHPSAETVRPNPGDDGVDTYVGPFGGEQRVWQSKYFCDGLGDAQKKQIRDSFRACRDSVNVTKLIEWTLCIPVELDIADRKWWEGWKKKQQEENDLLITLWPRSRIVPFAAKPDVADVFNLALRTGHAAAMPLDELLAELRRRRERVPLRDLPNPGMFRDAIFVRKLEQAGVTAHRARRTAFYNFDLLRLAVQHSGIDQDIQELDDLMIRVLALWEQEFTGWHDDNYGRRFVAHVESKIETAGERLATRLAMKGVHKQGALHGWADQCEAWWTASRPSFDDEPVTP